MLPEKQLTSSRKHGELGGVTSLTIVRQIRVDDKFDPMNFECNWAAGGAMSMRTCESGAREWTQDSLRLVLHVHLPRIGRCVVDERGVEVAVLGLKQECDSAGGRLCVGNRFGSDISVGVEPDAGVLLQVAVPSDEGRRFVGGMLCGSRSLETS